MLVCLKIGAQMRYLKEKGWTDTTEFGKTLSKGEVHVLKAAMSQTHPNHRRELECEPRVR